ncbi:MAG: hypothetical protein RL215_2574 [Planctomycetota bacterium]
MRVIGESGVKSPGSFFAECDGGVEAALEVGCEEVADFLRWDRAAAAILGFADEFNGVDLREKFVAVVAF